VIRGHPSDGAHNTSDGRRELTAPATTVVGMELLAAAGLFVALALVAALPLVLLLQLSTRRRDDGAVGSTTPSSG